jgi:cyclohexyl-isocyanide hydratase
MSLFKVGLVIFPDLTQLDFTGPQQVLARLPGSSMHIVAKTTEPVPSDSGLGLVPTHTFDNCPRLDLICVPGGNKGVIDALSVAQRRIGHLRNCCLSSAPRTRRLAS